VTEGNSAGEVTQTRDRWSAREPGLAALVYGGGYVLVCLMGVVVSGLKLSVVITSVFVLAVWAGTLLLSLLLVLSLCRLRMSARAEVVWLIGMVALFVLCRPEVLAVAGRVIGSAHRGRELTDALKVTPWQALGGNIALILWAIFLGRLVSRVLREGKLLLPVAVVASIADTITVFWGLVHSVAEKAPDILETFSAQTPVSAPPAVPLPILSSVGIGDFLFLAMFLTVAVRYAMDSVKATWATFALMLIAPMPFILWPSLPGMPGLPFISVAVLGTNWRHLRFTGEEKRALVFVGALVVAAAAWVILRH
jgi:hypothetical protein